MRKRKTLPKNFEEMLASAPLAELQAVFDHRRIDAYAGYTKHTALGFLDCPDELVTWLVAQGLDVDVPDSYGATALWTRADGGRIEQIPLLLSLGADINRARSGDVTPLHAAVSRNRVEATRLLLSRGADVHARTETGGYTPVEYALLRTAKVSLADTARIVELLLGAGATTTPTAVEEVERLAEGFAFHRADAHPDLVEEASAGLTRLQDLLGVAPGAPLVKHDGVSPIVVPAGRWQDCHQKLWEHLVPSSGAAATVQGEVIRISGRIADEVLGNGGVNWDRDYRRMLSDLADHLASGTPLPPEALAHTRSLVRQVGYRR